MKDADRFPADQQFHGLHAEHGHAIRNVHPKFAEHFPKAADSFGVVGVANRGGHLLAPGPGAFQLSRIRQSLPVQFLAQTSTAAKIDSPRPTRAVPASHESPAWGVKVSGA